MDENRIDQTPDNTEPVSATQPVSDGENINASPAQETPPAASFTGGSSAPANQSSSPYAQQPNYPPYGYYQSPMYGYPPFVQSQQPAPQEEPTRKAKKKPASRGVIAVCLVLCVLISGIGGFFGAYYALLRHGVTLYRNPGATTTVVYRDTSDNTEGTAASTDAFELAAETSARAVVEISTEKVMTSNIYGQYITGGAGSGVIISENGYIITCAHVVSGATSITVTMPDGQKFPAELVGSDSMTDIAVIKIDATGLPCAVIGNSDTLRVAQSVIAIGNPLGELGGTVTVGHISALNRRVEVQGQTYELLQTDTAINPGNSGGGLFDLNGHLIGIVNAKSTGEDVEGLGFSIPINAAMATAQQLMEKGYVSGRPALGIMAINYTSSSDLFSIRAGEYGKIVDYLTDYGVYFVDLNDGQTADFKFGDRIVAIDGIEVTTLSEITALLLDSYHPGDTVTVTVARITARDAKTIRKTMVDVTLTLVERIPE